MAKAITGNESSCTKMFKQRQKRKSAHAKESVVGASGSLVESVSELGHDVAESTSEFGHIAASKVEAASHTAKAACSKTKGQLEETIDSQPIVAALGALVGGLIVGSIPKTSRAENRLVGDYSDRVKKGIRNEAKSAVERGKTVVKDTVAHAVEELDEQGLTFHGIKDKVANVAMNVKDEAVSNAKTKLEKTSDSIADEAASVKDEIKSDIKNNIAND